MDNINTMEELLNMYGNEILDKDDEKDQHYRKEINETYYCHGIKVVPCISKYDSKSTYYTLINPKNKIHVHCSNKNDISDICICHEKIENGLPVKYFKHNIRNKAMKLIGYKVVYR